MSQHSLTEYDRKTIGMPAPDGSFQVRVRANDLNIHRIPLIRDYASNTTQNGELSLGFADFVLT